MPTLPPAKRRHPSACDLGLAINLPFEGLKQGNRFVSDQKGEKSMNSSANDQVAGKLHEVKGKVKEFAGQIVNNPDLEDEGKAENLGGKVQKKVGQIEKVFEK
jgi:uncharacterized protein YjbJ (UPF0337 family)